MINGLPKEYHLRQECRKKESKLKNDYIIIKDKCQICGRNSTQTTLHAHHEDYSKPFNLIILCWKCHQSYHQKWHEFVNFEGLPVAVIVKKSIIPKKKGYKTVFK